jgi:hypothetical protein
MKCIHALNKSYFSAYQSVKYHLLSCNEVFDKGYSIPYEGVNYAKYSV